MVFLKWGRLSTLMLLMKRLLLIVPALSISRIKIRRIVCKAFIYGHKDDLNVIKVTDKNNKSK
jgi:hypothetical protein